MYTITNYSRKKAQELGVDIKPSTNKTKKLDVFKNGIKVASIGSITNLEIASNSINGSKIISGTISKSQLAANIFNGVSVTANSLSDISTNLGTVTAGALRSLDGKMVIDLSSKIIRIEI